MWKFQEVIRELVLLVERNERKMLVVEGISSEVLLFLTLRNLQKRNRESINELCFIYLAFFFFGILYTWFFIVSTTNFNNIHTSPLSHSQDMLKSEIRGNPSVICRSSTILDTQNKILGYLSSDTRNYRSNEFYAFVDRIFILSKVCLRKMNEMVELCYYYIFV